MNAPTNTGHGHVHQRPDGVKARCGGPALCAQCWREQAALNAPESASTASAITDEQIIEQVENEVGIGYGYWEDTWVTKAEVVAAFRKVLALNAAPTTQPAPAAPSDLRERMVKFFTLATERGIECDGVNACDLFEKLLPEDYAAAFPASTKAEGGAL